MSEVHQENPLVWIDCEMTGLDPETDSVLEIYCYITNGDLELLEAEGWGAVIHHPQETLDAMDEWCTRTHAQTGLTPAVLSSTTTASAAAASLLSYLQSHIPPKTALLAGNSVHFDAAFLRKGEYKQIMDYLAYRILDVSAIKEGVRRWCPQDVLEGAPTKGFLHRGKEDILESIEECRYYRGVVFQRDGARHVEG